MARYQPKDKYYRQAKAKGLPSRAAFKLEELLSRFRLAPPGARVLDLGCAPGGWMKILARAVGPDGKVVGIDLSPVDDVAPNASAIQGDIHNRDVISLARDRLAAPADLVTSDLAPKLTGIRDRDRARVAELLETALQGATESLRPGGSMVVKVFMEPDLDRMVEKVRKSFKDVTLTRTQATRPGSSEMYLIARGFIG